MVTCQSCGGVNRDEANFCAYCGATIARPSPAPAGPPPTSAGPAPSPRSPAKPPDIVGMIGFALFLLILGVVVAANPNFGADLGAWIGQVSERGPFIRPPDGILASGVLFLALGGVSGLIQAGLRFVIDRGRPHRIVGDMLSGLGSFVLAYLLYVYLQRAISGMALIGGAIAVFGAIIVVSAVAGLYLKTESRTRGASGSLTR